HCGTFRPGAPSSQVIVISTQEIATGSEKRYMKALARKLIRFIKETSPDTLNPDKYNWCL
ncbi:MAG: hypothetical protein AAB855_04680, partial [Patescibacteria group bacterium]